MQGIEQATARQSGANKPREKLMLTDRLLRSLGPAELGKRRVIWDAAHVSFGVRVTDKGVRTFFVMRRLKGEAYPIRVALGRFPELSLAKARRLATVVLGDLASGKHPKEREREEQERKAERERVEAACKANTFASLASLYIQRHAAKKRTAVAIAQVIERHLMPCWGSQIVTEIKRADVIALIERVADRSGPEAARQVLTYAGAVFNFGLARDFGGLDRNPCHLVKKRALIGEPKPRQRVLSEAELRLIWQATDGPIERTYPVGPFVRLLLLTAARRSEVAKATWDEIDLGKALWVIPAHRMKVDQDHAVPLAPMAVELLKSLPRFSSDFVFTVTGRNPINGFGGFKVGIDRRIARISPASIGDWRFHDLRRTARTYMATLGVSPFIGELVIGHRQKGVHAIYDVHRYQAEKRDALERWAAKLRGIVEPQPDNVLPFAVQKPNDEARLMS